jgi:hypothetical protein
MVIGIQDSLDTPKIVLGSPPRDEPAQEFLTL